MKRMYHVLNEDANSNISYADKTGRKEMSMRTWFNGLMDNPRYIYTLSYLWFNGLMDNPRYIYTFILSLV